MVKILAIAVNTFREAVRDKILYSLLIFALLMIVSSVFLSTLSVGDQIKIIQDMGLSMISIFGTLIAIFVGIGLVYKEIEKRTIYSIIAKPIARHQFLMGKYCGLILTLLVEITVMSSGFLLLLYFYPGSYDASILKAIYLIFIELMIVTAIALLFSSFSTPILAPRLVPPCFMASVAESNTFMKEIGPLETPFVDATGEFAGRRREKLKPVPPPLL